jgi:hypothetical protein
MEEKSSINNNARNNINIHKETSKITRDIVKNANNISKNSKTILLQALIQLYRAGFSELTRYVHTNYIKYDPPHFIEWQCPKHQV